MNLCILKETLRALNNYTVLIPYNSIPVVIHNSLKVEYTHRLIPNPVYTDNEKYHFISSMYRKGDHCYFNNIASMIRERDMFGDVIIYKKNYINSSQMML